MRIHVFRGVRFPGRVIRRVRSTLPGLVIRISPGRFIFIRASPGYVIRRVRLTFPGLVIRAFPGRFVFIRASPGRFVFVRASPGHVIRRVRSTFPGRYIRVGFHVGSSLDGENFTKSHFFCHRNVDVGSFLRRLIIGVGGFRFSTFLCRTNFDISRYCFGCYLSQWNVISSFLFRGFLRRWDVGVSHLLTGRFYNSTLINTCRRFDSATFYVVQNIFPKDCVEVFGCA